MPKLDCLFVPAPVGLTKAFDTHASLVWGLIWRNGGQGERPARMSHEYMAGEIGVSVRTVQRRLKKLEKAGYIEDLDPGLTQTPHRYQILKGAIKLVAVGFDDTGAETPPEGVNDTEAESSGQSDGNFMPGGPEVPDTETEHDIPHEKDHEIDHEKNIPATQVPADPPPPKRPDQIFFEDLAGACDWDLATITDAQRGQVQQAMGILRNKAGAQPADMTDFREWWDANDWRGKRGDSPRPDLVRSEWGRYKKWLRRRRDFQELEAQARNERSEVSEDPVDPNLKRAVDTWKIACEFLKGSLPRQTYGEYIAPLVVLVPNGKFRLGCNIEWVVSWLNNRLDPAVRSALHSAVGRPVDVEYLLTTNELEG